MDEDDEHGTRLTAAVSFIDADGERHHGFRLTGLVRETRDLATILYSRTPTDDETTATFGEAGFDLAVNVPHADRSPFERHCFEPDTDAEWLPSELAARLDWIGETHSGSDLSRTLTPSGFQTPMGDGGSVAGPSADDDRTSVVRPYAPDGERFIPRRETADRFRAGTRSPADAIPEVSHDR